MSVHYCGVVIIIIIVIDIDNILIYVTFLCRRALVTAARTAS